MGLKVARSRLQILDIAGIEERPLACDAAGPTGCRQIVAAGLVLQVTIADQGLQCVFKDSRKVVLTDPGRQTGQRLELVEIAP